MFTASYFLTRTSRSVDSTQHSKLRPNPSKSCDLDSLFVVISYHFLLAKTASTTPSWQGCCVKIPSHVTLHISRYKCSASPATVKDLSHYLPDLPMSKTGTWSRTRSVKQFEDGDSLALLWSERASVSVRSLVLQPRCCI